MYVYTYVQIKGTEQYQHGCLERSLYVEYLPNTKP